MTQSGGPYPWGIPDAYSRDIVWGRAAMAQPIAETQVMWTCSCGHRTFVHYQWCATCGKERPAPPPEAPPSDVTRGEAADVAWR